MYELKKGIMVMRNVSNEDKDIYVKSGWKVVKTPKDNKKKEKKIVKEEIIVENDSNDGIIEE